MNPPVTTTRVADSESRLIGSRSHSLYSRSAARRVSGIALIGKTASQVKGSNEMPSQRGTMTRTRNGTNPTNRPSVAHSIWRLIRTSRDTERQRHTWTMMPYITEDTNKIRSNDATAGHQASAPMNRAVMPELTTANTVKRSHPRIDRSRSGKMEKNRTIRKGNAAPALRLTIWRISSADAIRFGTAPRINAAAARRRKVAASRRLVLHTAYSAHPNPRKPTRVRAR